MKTMNCENCLIEFEPDRLFGGLCHPCASWRASSATEALRQLFYHRDALGIKLEAEILLENPELWRLCHQLLEPTKTTGCTFRKEPGDQNCKEHTP